MDPIRILCVPADHPAHAVERERRAKAKRAASMPTVAAKPWAVDPVKWAKQAHGYSNANWTRAKLSGMFSNVSNTIVGRGLATEPAQNCSTR